VKGSPDKITISCKKEDSTR